MLSLFNFLVFLSFSWLSLIPWSNTQFTEIFLSIFLEINLRHSTTVNISNAQLSVKGFESPVSVKMGLLLENIVRSASFLLTGSLKIE